LKENITSKNKIKKIILIACVKTKRETPSKAIDLYISPLFKKSLEYAQLLNPDKIYVLSAKYGLVSSEEVIEPYELTLNNMPTSEIKKWSKRVLDQLSSVTDLKNDNFIILAGQNYRKYLIPHIKHYEIPLEGLGFGSQLRRLDELIEEIKHGKLYFNEIRKAILKIGKSIPPKELFPTIIEEASDLIASNPYAFTIGVCLDRGTKAEIIWTIPYDIKKELGHLDPKIIYQFSLSELRDLFFRLPRHPRYINDAPKTIQQLTQIVVEECNGNAENIWQGKRAAQVNRTLQSIHGVGPGIASMGVLLIEAAFGIHFDDRDRIDIKPDVHTKRVLYRLGVSKAETEEATLNAARILNPDCPGELDSGLWWIGRNWCHASNPNCDQCPMKNYCKKIYK
jgi:endonuclease III